MLNFSCHPSVEVRKPGGRPGAVDSSLYVSLGTVPPWLSRGWVALLQTFI